MFSEDLEIMCTDCGQRGEGCKECKQGEKPDKKNYWAKICELNKQQEKKGIKKYGYTLENNPLKGVPVWIRYMEEELLDGLKYAEKILDEYEKYRWHDLKKDIEDIPKYSHDVLFCVNHGTKKAYFVIYYDSRRNEFIFQSRVWKFIPEEWIELKWKELEP